MKKSYISTYDKTYVHTYSDGSIRMTRVNEYYRNKHTIEPLDKFLKEMGWIEQ